MPTTTRTSSKRGGRCAASNAPAASTGNSKGKHPRPTPVATEAPTTAVDLDLAATIPAKTAVCVGETPTPMPTPPASTDAVLRASEPMQFPTPPSSISSSVVVDVHEVRRLRTQLQAMKEQVYFLHKMMQGLSQPEKDMLKGKHMGHPSKRMSFAGISPVKKVRRSVDIIVMPDEKVLFSDKWSLPGEQVQRQSFIDVDIPQPSTATKLDELERKIAALETENASLKSQLEDASVAAKSVMSECEETRDGFSAKIAVLEAENAQLRSNIEAYEEENIRLHGALAQTNEEQDTSLMSSVNQPQYEGEQSGQNDLNDELGIDAIGEEPEADHERCEAKIHELWQTIKTLKVYVETFRVEIEDLTVQRDQAIASAERAWEENTKLAGNSNPQQKIKYLEAVKRENAELLQKVRDLQSRLAKRQLRGDDPRKKKNSLGGSEPHRSFSDSGDEYSDDGSEAERTKLLKKMWARNKKLEEEIDRLRKEKQRLAMRQLRSVSVDSRNSSSKSSSSRWKS